MAIPILGIFQVIGSLVGSWMEKKKVEAEGRIQIARAKVEGDVRRAQTYAEGEVKYDQTAAEGMATSWKDEWFVLLLSIPAVLCFIPGMDEVVAKGFAALATTPDWYQWAFLGAIVASFGLKTWKGFKKGNGSSNEVTG